MRNDQLREEYLQWMRHLVCNDRYSKKASYKKLFRYLNDIDFEYLIEKDGNRAEDGTNLRYRFGSSVGYEDRVIATCVDIRPCSVLEMMIALAVRCEENIMDDPDLGDRTGQWFWTMIVNLGLGKMTDDNFDVDYVDNVVDIFLNREYAYNGTGGLFVVENPAQDMRDVEIWYQMCWYLNEII